MSEEKGKRITQSTIINVYGISKKNIKQYLPKPEKVQNPFYKSAAPMMLWNENDVIRIIEENPKLQEAIAKRSSLQVKKKEKEKDAIKFLLSFSPQKLLERGAALKRKFILHIGPTNSGKTYNALQALKQTPDGLYLGPLRLLALEVSETLNAEGYPCSLVTGEESVKVPNAFYTASTIELCDYDHHYDTIVIDEAQMISDRYRGNQWFKAICLADADTVVVCGAPEVQSLLEQMCEEMGCEYEVIYHKRMVPLKFSGTFDSIEDVHPGDALIAFGRKKVLMLASQLEQHGMRVSVIYGALPPASRREEVRRFAEKETQVVVATDAIGMGISLPIRRVLFTETKKYNGDDVLPLSVSEIKQIAGRAGRFGKYDLGEVLTYDDPTLVKKGLDQSVSPIKKITIGFPEEALEYSMPLKEMLHFWNTLPNNESFARADMRDAAYLLHSLGAVDKKISKEFIYELITCPVDVKKEELVDYWTLCCAEMLHGENPPLPEFSDRTLEQCEIKYRAYDIYHQLMRKIGVEEDCMEEKMLLAQKINDFLKTGKTQRMIFETKRRNKW